MNIPLLIVITHFIWISGWWAFGHFIFLIYYGWEDNGIRSFTNHTDKDYLAMFFLCMASYLYVWIGQKVIQVLYGKELPTEMISQIAHTVLNNNIPRDERRKIEKQLRKNK